MIKSIDIFNFQSHKKTHIDFHPNVNVFIGQSDCGKTAILRALNWIRTNKPLGDSFRSKWGGDTRVKIETDDELAISRIKTNKDNKYVLDLPDGTPESGIEFKAMGQGVPAEITKALSVPDLNVEYQMDPPFLLSSNAGDVAQMLNMVSGLDTIDTAQSNINTKVRNINAALTFEKEQLEENEKKLKTFDYLKDMECDIAAVEKLDTRVQQLRQDKEDLDSTFAAIDSLYTRLDELTYVSKAGKEIAQLIEVNEQKIKAHLKASVLDYNLNAITDTESALNSFTHLSDAEALLKKILSMDATVRELDEEGITLSRVLDFIIQTNQKLSKYTQLDKKSQLLNEIISLNEQADTVYNNKEALTELVQAILRTQTRLKEKTDSLHVNELWWETNAPDTCPLCIGKGTLK